MNCAYFPGWNIGDLIMCTFAGIGIPNDILGLGILAAFILFSLWARLDFNISLGLAVVVSYTLMLIIPGSVILPIITGLLFIGIAFRVLIGIIAMLRQ